MGYNKDEELSERLERIQEKRTKEQGKKVLHLPRLGRWFVNASNLSRVICGGCMTKR